MTQLQSNNGAGRDDVPDGLPAIYVVNARQGNAPRVDARSSVTQPQFIAAIEG